MTAASRAAAARAPSPAAARPNACAANQGKTWGLESKVAQTLDGQALAAIK